MNKVLDVYLHEIYAGQLIQNESGRLLYQYDVAYVEERHPALSISLPVQQAMFEGDVVKAFFSGLLPDDAVRTRLARYLGVSEQNPFALLKAIGGECAGAIAIYAHGEALPNSSSDDIEILGDQKLQDILTILKRQPLFSGDDGLRLSLAGAQDKLAVGIKDGKIALMKGTLPTTHILKPLIDDIESSVHNEFFCMRLAKLIEIKVPHVEIRYVGDIPFYLIERYDRGEDTNGKVFRIHQEDFCQALSVFPEKKYEREGGPSLARCQDLLRQHSIQPAVDGTELIKRVIYNYLIGNADAHAKNFSFLYIKDKPALSPAYDLLSTAVYPNVSIKMAMKIGGKYIPDDVLLRHWHRIVPDTTVAQKNIEKQLLAMANDCVEQAVLLREQLKREDIESPIFDKIYDVIRKRSEHLRL
ncbi:MAG: type II toxin-antitoxin system HipA family toxin [Gammaproteobacteria bacterium]